MITVKDQLGNIIQLKSKAKRIISVVPSQTELLFDLGLNDEVVGITKFCIHPRQWFKNKKRVGGTKTLNFDVIKQLQPDLIIANKEENTQTEIEFLQKHYKVYVSDITTLDDAYQMMTDVAELTQTTDKANKLINQIKRDFEILPQFDVNVLYLIWQKPFMAAGQKTFINHLLNKIGITNIISDKNSRYIKIDNQILNRKDIDFIFLSSEPYPFKEKHIKDIKREYNGIPVLVDGEMFSWYGSRLKYFKTYVTGKLADKLV